MLSFKVKIDDKEMFKEIAGKHAAVDIGFFENQYYEPIEKAFYANVALPKKGGGVKARRIGTRPKIPVAKVALANEYGVPEKGVPPRPFMWRTLDGNAKKWAKKVQNELPQMKKMDLVLMAKKVASVAVRDMKRTIEELQYPPNAPSTIRQKGFNNPLIDSGQMRDSVTWRMA